VIVSRGFGLADPRSYGSGNPGATNVLRSGHRGAAVLTLALDALKGYLPVLAVLLLGPRFGLGEGTAALAALAAFVGHVWPVFFHFRGGKGVATAAGALLALNPWLGAATLLTWIIIAAFFRYSSLASIVAALFAPFYELLIWGVTPALPAVAAMSLLLVWRHEGNIRKLIAGTESRLGQKAAPAAAAAERHAHGHGHGHGHGHAHPHRKGKH
jgi:glycerol-3-phosphate acyltransferase PlsY